MTTALRVDDIASYLAETGWLRAPRDWHGVGVWNHPDDYEVLVPAHEGFGDARARINEILRCLATLEDRPVPEIAAEIARPDADTQLFQTFPADRDPGYTSVAEGYRAVQGVRDVLAIATRTVVQGPHFTFAGRPPNVVADLLRAAEMGPTRAGSYVLEVRLSARTSLPGGVTGRTVTGQIHEAITAAGEAVSTGQLSAFEDQIVTAGLSANLCTALSDLGGIDHGAPFEIGFRWGRAVPTESNRSSHRFPAGAGVLLREAADQLRTLDASGAATIAGPIETLHHGATRDEQWRISVRGEFHTGTGPVRRRKVWVRLPNQAAYDRAIAVHHRQLAVRVSGELSSSTGRVELVPDRGFDVID
ncbi:hypothetical protein GCM10010399_23050 [Dactylosporangium fulvum]|uniref:Uncharacterized protein n=1 Tax=Dactylosporangium fulvum TaxID=53359 RepID=A0ABY5VY60_9ACTN|nr:hypothetical protein [Dactylosporangium fulvum]UWP82212.1 hypothetical protein Dfulv_45320 [Dactylosporangium fulvum]